MHSLQLSDLSRFALNKIEDNETLKHSQYEDGDVCITKSNSNIEINLLI